MRSITQMIMSASMSLMIINSSVMAGESCKLQGIWKLVAFDAEDVTTKVVVHIYGERPSGYMTMTCGGRFGASAGIAHIEPVQSIWEEVARTLANHAGSYRLDGNKIIVRYDKARYEGWTVYYPLDSTSNQGKLESESIRNFRLTPNGIDGDILLIETPPMPSPNGAGNTIVGRVVWRRMLVATAN
jgi:Lipocalin-like domain